MSTHAPPQKQSQAPSTFPLLVDARPLRKQRQAPPTFPYLVDAHCHGSRAKIRQPSCLVDACPAAEVEPSSTDLTLARQRTSATKAESSSTNLPLSHQHMPPQMQSQDPPTFLPRRRTPRIQIPSRSRNERLCEGGES